MEDTSAKFGALVWNVDSFAGMNIVIKYMVWSRDRFELFYLVIVMLQTGFVPLLAKAAAMNEKTRL